MSDEDIDTLFAAAIDRLEHPLYTINLDACHGMSEKQIETLKDKFSNNGYIFADGRKNGWNLLWVKKP